jgi:hypothetical protein
MTFIHQTKLLVSKLKYGLSLGFHEIKKRFERI